MRVPSLTIIAAVSAGAMTSVWLNATETEVYAASLALSIATIVVADEYGRSGRARWLVLASYLIALAIPLHASALVASPVAIYLATARAGSHPTRRAYDWRAGTSLAGVAVCSIGVSRLSIVFIAIGACLVLAGAFMPSRGESIGFGTALGMLTAVAAAMSILAFMLLRARHDPGINQGNPATWDSLLQVIGRKQYDVQGMWPREAPIWLQVANWFEYADWQFALSLAPTVIPTPARVLVTIAFAALGLGGARWHRRTDRRGWFAVLLLFVCGSLGVIIYLNLRAGASFAWQMVPNALAHEARDRDYFFVLGFWAWGLWAGMGALALARRLRVPSALGAAVAVLPIALNWSVIDRRGGIEAELPREVARALLEPAPRHAVLFVEGDNDTYPLWYAQRVEHLRPDVTVVTLPLLPARWNLEELARRDSLLTPERAATGRVSVGEIASGAAARGRPVAVATTVDRATREALGRSWVVAGPLLLAAPLPSGGVITPDSLLRVDTTTTRAWADAIEKWRKGRVARPSLDPADEYFLNVLSCPRLTLLSSPSPSQLVSLDSTCNRR